MRYLTGEDILVIHARIIEETSGAHGVRDLHLFSSIIERPKAAFGGQEMYSDMFSKAAAYLESLARYHVFFDGNKRTALATAAYFLHMNGYEFFATNKIAEQFILKVVVKKLSIPDIAEWLKRHVRTGK